MDNDLKNAIQESLPDDAEGLQKAAEELDVAEDSSSSSPAESTAQKGETKEVPFHEHPRWKEVQSQREQARLDAQRERARADRLESQIIELSNRITKSTDKDPYEGMSAEDKAFWQKIKEISRQEAEGIASAQVPILQREIREVKTAMAHIAYEKFKEKHPDVLQNSEEENKIAQKLAQGYDLEDAYQVVMGPINIKKAQEEAEAKVKNKQTQKMSTKMAANLEGPDISRNSPIQPKKKQSVGDFIEEWMAKNST